MRVAGIDQLVGVVAEQLEHLRVLVMPLPPLALETHAAWIVTDPLGRDFEGLDRVILMP